MQLFLIYSQGDPEWPWSQAYVKHTGVMGTPRKILNLATVVMNGTEVFSKHEWTWDRWYPLLKGKAGEEIQVGCRMINGSTHERATQIIRADTFSDTMAKKHCTTDEQDCWHNFTLVECTIVACLWQQHKIGLSFKFKTDMVGPDPTTLPNLVPHPPSETLVSNYTETTLLSGIRNLPLHTIAFGDDPWNHALSRYTASIGTPQNKRGLNLSTLVIQGNKVYSRGECC